MTPLPKRIKTSKINGPLGDLQKEVATLETLVREAEAEIKAKKKALVVLQEAREAAKAKHLRVRGLTPREAILLVGIYLGKVTLKYRADYEKFTAPYRHSLEALYRARYVNHRSPGLGLALTTSGVTEAQDILERYPDLANLESYYGS